MTLPEELYSKELLGEIAAAPQDLPGVKLANICIWKRIPVSDVAKHFEVSHPVILFWFTGRVPVPRKYLPKVEHILEQLG